MAEQKQAPQIPENEWEKIVPEQTLREGKELVGAVHDVLWSPPEMRGKVNEGARRFFVVLDLASREKIRSRCTCDAGQAGKICKHAIAIYFSHFSRLLRASEAARERAAILANLRANSAPKPFEKSEFPREISVPRSVPVSGNVRTPASAGTLLGKTSPARGAVPTRATPAPSRTISPSASANASPRPLVDGNGEWISVVLPARTAPNYAAVYDKVKYGFFDLDARSGRWFLRGEHKVLCFLAREWEKFRERFSPKMTPEFHRTIQRMRFASLRTDITEQGDKFELSVSVDTCGVSPAEIDSALVRSCPYAKDKRGRIVLIPSSVSEKMAAVRERLDRGENYTGSPTFRRKISRAELASAECVLEELGVNFEPPETWRERSGALRDLSRLRPAPVPENLNSQLRIYQQIGVAWLWHLHKNQLGGILADEMGLGKTVEAIAFLSAFFAENSSGEETAENLCALVVAPAGLVENWRRELARFAPAIPVLVHHGQQRSAEALGAFPRGIVLTSYAVLRIDNEDFLASPWRVVIADEAQQVKNRRSRNSRALREIPAATRFVLTGTPVENSIEDLRTLFDFILPGFMPGAQTGGGESAFERRARDNATVRALAAPYILRRTKQFVAPELPPRIEQLVWCRLGDAQSRLYADWKERSHREIFNMEMAGASDGKLRVAAFNQLLRLRQICTEPRLLDPDFREDDCAKLRALREILDEAVAGGHRVLVFSQFVSVLNFLKDALRADGIAFAYIDGATKNRAEVCAKFNADESVPVCLISLKAGGVGLNLTGADMVVHYDPWWNPAVEAQATDRAHRIGQTRAVTSVKLVVADSVEERVLELQHEKRELMKSVFEASDAESEKISLADMKALLA